MLTYNVTFSFFFVSSVIGETVSNIADAVSFPNNYTAVLIKWMII